MKRALLLASVASMIDQFNISNIQNLQAIGFNVDVAANFTDPGTITKKRCEELKKKLNEMNVNVYDVPIPRKMNPIAISKSYNIVKQLLDENNYSIMHCHSPIGGVIARAGAIRKRRTGLKVIYTAHGFHFYDGAPLKNWLLYYPIEKFFSRFTDVLITINREDYKRACERFKARRIVYVPGVGVDIMKFSPDTAARDRVRTELGISKDRILLLSVGELNENKNHVSVIKALKDMDVTYAIVGRGSLGDKLKQTARENNVDLRLMGFRDDVKDFYCASDVFILPSIREGLNVSLMEAMACGLPCCVGKIRGNVDLINDCLFLPTNITEIKNAISNALENKKLGDNNRKTIRSFDTQVVNKLMLEIYMELC